MAAVQSDYDMSDSSSHGTSNYSSFSSPSQEVPHLIELEQASRPFLKIIEEPQKRIRFRYDSEMAGTHGCLLGKSSGGRNKEKTYPAVQLVNHEGQALLMCQLAESNSTEEHPHKLAEDDLDKPVSKSVPENGSYSVAFRGISIIKTVKNDVPTVLLNRLRAKHGIQNSDDNDLQALCEKRAKNIDLNIVRLKFSAYDIHTGEELCEPVFSKPIYDLRSPATNNLKICRMTPSSASALGGQDLFLLVDKVKKNNIKVQFFELDANGKRIWTENAPFLETDVHYQYAIVCRIPSYKDRETAEDVKVYIELVRPSDGLTSEPKEFKYKADQAYKHIKRRKMCSTYSSINSIPSGALKRKPEPPIPVSYNQLVETVESDIFSDAEASLYLNELLNTSSAQYHVPAALGGCDPNQPLKSDPMWSQTNGMPPPSEKSTLQEATDKFDMTEFLQQYFKNYNEEFPVDKALDQCIDFALENMVTDSALATNSEEDTVKEQVENGPIQSEYEVFYTAVDRAVEQVPDLEVVKPQMDDTPHVVKLQMDDTPHRWVTTEYDAFFNAKDGAEVKKLVTDVCELIKTNKYFKKQEIRSSLDRLFNIRLSNGDTLLHMTLFCSPASLHYIVKVIDNVKAAHLLDCSNDMQQTALHLAILNDMPDVVRLLVAKGANPMLKDVDELNAVHYAVKYKSCLEPLLDAIKKNEVPSNLNEYNSEKQSALHMAVVEGSERSARLLLQHGASHRVRDEYGRTPLHLAAYDDRLAVTKTLLDFIPLVRTAEKQSALHMAVVEGSERSARLLLQHGASHRVRDEYGRTPLHLAAYDDRLAVTKTLLDFIPLSEIDLIDDAGNTALQIVCGNTIREHSIDIARLLLDMKANPMKKEDDNKSAWRLVRHKPELKSLLRDYVATEVHSKNDIQSMTDDDFESADECDSEEHISLDSLAVVLEKMELTNAAATI